MLRRLRELDERGLMISRLSESAEMGEAHDQPDAVADGYWYEASEGLVDPVGGEHGEIVSRQLDHRRVLAAHEMRESQQTCGEDTELHVLEPPGDLQGPEASHERLVQFAEKRLGDCHRRIDPTASAVVVQPLGDGLGL